MNKTEYKNQTILRPYKILGYSLGSVVFYANGKELLRVGSGWLENENNDLLSIFLEEVKKANKINLNRKDNFLVFTRNDEFKDWLREKEAILYINVELEGLKISELGEIPYYENEKEKIFKQFHLITGLKHSKSTYSLKTKKWEVVYFNEGTPIKQIISHRTELKELGLKIKRASDFLKEKGKDYSVYKVEEIIEVYNEIKHILEGV